MKKRRYIIFFTVTVLLILGLIWLSLYLGSTRLGAEEILRILGGDREDTAHMNIIMNIRLPMAMAALLLGGALALSGYMLQTFFGNPIVGPFVLGISSGSKLAVALVMIL